MTFERAFRTVPLAYISLAFIAGLLLAHLFQTTLISSAFLIGILSVILKARRGSSMTKLSILAIFLWGWLTNSNHLGQLESMSKQCEKLGDSTIVFSGIATEIKPSRKGLKISLKDGRIALPDNSILNGVGLFIYITGDTAISKGDTIAGSGSFRLIRGKRNPGAFDFNAFYARKGFFGNIYTEEIFEIKGGDQGSILARISTTRQWIRNTFTQYLGSSSGLITALILGDKSQVDPEVKQHFVETGVVHVLAVSGLHVGYVLFILLGLAKVFRIPWGVDKVIVIMGLLFFAELTGGKPSVVRAVTMASLYLLSSLLNRPTNLWNIISAAGLGILIINPGYLFDLGFLFSFTAVISIVFFYNLFQKVLPENLQVEEIESKAFKWIWALFLVSLSAQLGTLPLTAYYFHRIPVISLVANIIIVPLIGLLVAIGFSILFLSWLPGAGYIFGQAGWGLTNIIQMITKGFSSFPISNIDVPEFTLTLAGVYIFAVASAFLIVQKEYFGKGILCFLVSINLMVWPKALERKTLDIIYLDVGQGDAALIKFPDRKAMLIDAGQRTMKEDYGKTVVLPVLSFLGIKRLNWVIMSHPHSDHIGGLVSIIESIPIDTVLDTHLDYESWTYTHLIQRFSEKSIVINRVQKGDVFSMENGGFIQILAPDSSFSKQTKIVNNSSIVLKLIYGDIVYLFTGDLEKEGDSYIIDFKDHLKADILKVAHHGSITSSTESLLNWISPDLAVVSVGKNNKFRHPSPVVINRFEKRGIDVHRTDESGALWIKSDGKKYWINHWK